MPRTVIRPAPPLHPKDCSSCESRMPSERQGYPEQLQIKPLATAPRVVLSVPGSKSITNRALVLAAQCRNGDPVCLVGALHSEDTEVMIDSLRRLGFEIGGDSPQAIFISRAANSPLIANAQADLFVGNSGTTMRFLTALVS